MDLQELKSEVLSDMMRAGAVKTNDSARQAPAIRYKIYMEARRGGSKIDVLRYHITTRNFFAFMLRKPLVGFTLYQALVDLHERLEEYLPPSTVCAANLKSYLVWLGLVNVCNEPRAAAGLLAWSEDVKWDEGWREAYVHSVGMYERVFQLQESADISLPTRAHLQRGHLELQVRVQEAEAHLADFYFDDVHFAQEDMSPTIRATSDRFRRFLKRFYEKEYQSWPIRRVQRSDALWLNRAIVKRLQNDFSALYEHFVNRDVVWSDEEDDENRKARRWLKSVNHLNFGLDGEDYRMLGVFRNLDCRLNAPHIPHPYPILPGCMTALPPSKKSMFSGKKTDKVRETRVAHCYAEASNSYQLSREHAENELAQAFVRFEKADQASEIDPREARRERWIIIYCVLQTLASISPDVPHLSFKENVSYFLNARLSGLPPWKPTEQIFMEASREHSHCWTATEEWQIDQYERCGPTRTKSVRSKSSGCSYDNRPLSPEAHSMTYSPSMSELEATEVCPQGFKSPYVDISMDPNINHTSKASSASIIPLSKYHFPKPLPMRPQR